MQTCGKCGGSMEQGFVMDKAYARMHIEQHEWVEGPVEHSWWTGLKYRGRRRIPIITYRCTACGLLESYATQ